MYLFLLFVCHFCFFSFSCGRRGGVCFQVLVLYGQVNSWSCLSISPSHGFLATPDSSLSFLLYIAFLFLLFCCPLLLSLFSSSPSHINLSSLLFYHLSLFPSFHRSPSNKINMFIYHCIPSIEVLPMSLYLHIWIYKYSLTV